MVHIHNGVLLSHKNNKIMLFEATWMQLETLIRSEVSQKEKDKYHISLICEIWNMAQMNLSAEQKETHRHEEQTWGCRGGGTGRDWEFGVSRCKLLHLKWISNDVLLCSTGNCIQSLVIEHDRIWEKEWIVMCVCIYTYIWLGHFAVQQKLTEHCKSTII